MVTVPTLDNVAVAAGNNPGPLSLEELARGACPVCLLASEYVKGCIRVLVQEPATSGLLREQLARAQGICARHSWQVSREEDSLESSTVADTIFLELTERALANLESGVHLANDSPLYRGRGPRRIWEEFRNWFSHPNDMQERNANAQGVCPLCELEQEAEGRHLRTLVERMKDQRFREQYAESRGLCLPHLRSALNYAPDIETRLFLATTAREHVISLLYQIQEYARKHNWNNRNEAKLTEEQESPFRAIAFEVGERT